MEHVLQHRHQIIADGRQQFRGRYLWHFVYFLEEVLSLDCHIALVVGNTAIEWIKYLERVGYLLIKHLQLIKLVQWLNQFLNITLVLHWVILNVDLGPIRLLLQRCLPLHFYEIVECLPEIVAVHLDVGLLVAWSALEQHWEDGVRYRLVVRVYHFLDYGKLVAYLVTSVFFDLVLRERNYKPQIYGLIKNELVDEHIHQVNQLAISVTETGNISENNFTLRLSNEIRLKSLGLSLAMANCQLRLVLLLVVDDRQHLFLFSFDFFLD